MDSDRQSEVSGRSIRFFSVNAGINSKPHQRTSWGGFNVQEPVTDHKLQLEDSWKVETLGISEPVSANDDDKALQKFNDTVRFEDGRYQVTNLALEGRVSTIINQWWTGNGEVQILCQ